MSIKFIIIGVVTLFIGILFFIWDRKNPLFNEDEDDGSIESGASQWANKQRDQKGYIGIVVLIIVGIILIYKGIMGG